MSKNTISDSIDFSNSNVIKEFSKALVAKHNIRTQDDLYGKNGIIPELQKALYEAILEGELDHHLGHDKHGCSSSGNYRNGYSDKTIKTNHGEIKIDIPRDRNGTFEPLAIPKYERRVAIIDDTIISLYSKGLSLSQVVEQIRDVYQVELSEDQVSTITDRVMEEIAKWQIRPLDRTYPIIYLDGIYIRDWTKFCVNPLLPSINFS